ncbi:MAG: hypothetical protein HY964_02955 [Ignavibacteriales bacterium]|nr:hypothetical protein [Ignavibacteriales bacterium]
MKSRIKINILISIVIASSSFAIPVMAQNKTNAIGEKYHSSLLNINNISMWASDDGLMEYNPNTQTAGVSFPRGIGHIVNRGGLIWGGKVYDNNAQVLRVGGQTTQSGTLSGRIITSGIGENQDNSDVKIYRIRKDWATADLKHDASEFFNLPLIDIGDEEIQQLREIYQNDWIYWPWQKGAPYYEKNGIPGYQPDPNGMDSTQDEPGLGSADQVIWYVANDLYAPNVTALYGSVPIGLEMQVTCWAYKNNPDLKNVIFQRYRLIYKGTSYTPPTATIESMYVAKWVDPDIGNYSDDFVGSDPDNNLGYGYNSRTEDVDFAKSNNVPPVVGYALLQGPRVPKLGGRAKWNLEDISDFENLDMTAFTYFSNSNRSTDYTFRDYQGTLEWYNLLSGFQRKPLSPPTCFFDPVGQQCTKYELDGDPELFHGWIDGIPDSAGDRRFAVISGPFSMAYGDTQEVVYALLAGQGTDNRNGITTIKSYAKSAYDAYYLNFRFPDPVPNPPLRVVELDNQIIFDWESDTTKLKQVESYSSCGYRFETYTLYQYPLPDSPMSDRIIYQFFDPTQPRMLYITEDKIRNEKLINGQRYYFALTTSAYNSDRKINKSRIESPIKILEITPHSPNPGTIIPYSIGDTLSDAINIAGRNDAVVNIMMYDPSKLYDTAYPDGHSYEILYHRNSVPALDFEEKPKFSLIDQTTNDTLIYKIPVDSKPKRVETRGFALETLMPLHGMKSISLVKYKSENVYSSIFENPSPENEFMIVGPGSSTLDSVKGQGLDDIDMELHFDGDSSWTLYRAPTAISSRWVRVPFTAWERKIVNNDTVYRQLFTTIVPVGEDTIWESTDYLNRVYNGKPMLAFPPIVIISDSEKVGGSYYLNKYYDDLPYNPNQKLYRALLWFNGYYYSKNASVSRAIIVDLDNDNNPAPSGTAVRFERFQEIRNGDKKYFKPKQGTISNFDAAKEEMKKINVFPNPYYGMNRAEINRLSRFVTFNHLPYSATIRIFTLAGIHARTIIKNDDTQFARWDLNNENGLPVAAGLYLAHIELYDISGNRLGERILKLMIIPEDLSPFNN